MSEASAMNEGRIAKPVGRILRLLTGAALTYYVLRISFASAETTLNPQVAGIVLGLFVFYAVVHLAIARFVPSINAWLGAFVAVTPVFLVFALAGPAGRLGSVLFIGVSLVVTALRSDGGCEVMALPGLVMGKRTHLVCIVFSPFDWVEDKLTGGMSPAKDEAFQRRLPS